MPPRPGHEHLSTTEPSVTTTTRRLLSHPTGPRSSSATPCSSGLRGARRARPGRSATLIMIVALVLGASGCGPFGYLTKVARDATRAVADAEKAGAEQY